MSFINSRFGNWLFRNWLYRYFWQKSDRRFYRWVKYGKEHGLITGIVSSGRSLEHTKEWVNEMTETYKDRTFWWMLRNWITKKQYYSESKVSNP